MPSPDQLEVISQNGAVAFHDLDPGKGLTNIGRHPENDIVIDSPAVADFVESINVVPLTVRG
jgi:hypothetical protein